MRLAMKTAVTDKNPAHEPVVVQVTDAGFTNRSRTGIRWPLPGIWVGGHPSAEAVFLDGDIYVTQWEGKRAADGGMSGAVFQISDLSADPTVHVAHAALDDPTPSFPIKAFVIGVFFLPTPLTGVYVVDFAKGALTKFASFADMPQTPLQQWAGFDQPHDVVMDSAGNLYVSDSNHHQIVQIPLHGGRPAKWSAGLNYPCGLAFSNGSLYVADTGNHRVLQVPYVTTNFPPKAASVQVSQVRLNMPSSIAADEAGNIYVIDGKVELLGLVDNPSQPRFPTASYGPRLSVMENIQGSGFVSLAHTEQVFNGAPVALCSGLNGLYASGAFRCGSLQASVALLPQSALGNFRSLANASQTRFQLNPGAQPVGAMGIFVDRAIEWVGIT